MYQPRIITQTYANYTPIPVPVTPTTNSPSPQSLPDTVFEQDKENKNDQVAKFVKKGEVSTRYIYISLTKMSLRNMV